MKEEDESKQKSGIPSHFLHTHNFTEGAVSSVPSVYMKGATALSSPNIATPTIFNQFTPAAVSHIDLA